MVTIISVKSSESKEGKEFFSLEIQGGVESVQSQSTGRFYLTARSCFIPTTFDEQTCQRLVGTMLKGSVIRVESEPYEYTVPETGEVITLTHHWEYCPLEETAVTEKPFLSSRMVAV